MTIFQKFGVSFALALSLHILLLAMFGISFLGESELVKQKPLPDIIQASMLDDEKIQHEANRLKAKQKNKRVAQEQQQQALDEKRKNEQKLLQETQKKRKQEEKLAKELQQKRQTEEKQRQAEVNKLKAEEAARQAKVKQLKAEEAARLAKIKQQKIVEKKRQDDLRKAEAEKREKERIAQEKFEQEKIANQKAAAAELKRQAEAKEAENRKTTISVKQAIQLRVINQWIKPPFSTKGLKALVRVKLLPSGDVMDAVVIQSSGDNIFDRSAENAVRKASPLPVPKDRALFRNKFRQFNFTFSPE